MENKKNVKARSVKTMRGVAPKVMFMPADSKVASYKKVKNKNSVFDCNNIVRFKES